MRWQRQRPAAILTTDGPIERRDVGSAVALASEALLPCSQ